MFGFNMLIGRGNSWFLPIADPGFVSSLSKVQEGFIIVVLFSFEGKMILGFLKTRKWFLLFCFFFSFGKNHSFFLLKTKGFRNF